MLAVQSESEQVLGALLSAGAVPDASDPTGRTALHHASARGQFLCARMLIDAGANVDLPDAYG